MLKEEQARLKDLLDQSGSVDEHISARQYYLDVTLQLAEATARNEDINDADAMSTVNVSINLTPQKWEPGTITIEKPSLYELKEAVALGISGLLKLLYGLIAVAIAVSPIIIVVVIVVILRRRKKKNHPHKTNEKNSQPIPPDTK